MQWRSALEFPTEAVTREARSADLVVIGQTKGWASKFDPLDPGAAILRMGRPTLVVPEGISSLSVEHVVIAWKDAHSIYYLLRIHPSGRLAQFWTNVIEVLNARGGR